MPSLEAVSGNIVSTSNSETNTLNSISLVLGISASHGPEICVTACQGLGHLS